MFYLHKAKLATDNLTCLQCHNTVRHREKAHVSNCNNILQVIKKGLTFRIYSCFHVFLTQWSCSVKCLAASGWVKPLS